jgi:hypothetical protein
MNQIEQMTIDKIRNLSPELQQQILIFVEFIEFRAKSEPVANTQSSIATSTSNKRQGFGLWKGAINIHDDFDEPLLDFEEYM